MDEEEPPPPVDGHAYHANADNDDMVSVTDGGGGANNGNPTPAMLPISDGEIVIPLFHSNGVQGGSVDGRDSHITPYEGHASDEDDSDDDAEDEDDATPSKDIYARIWGSSGDDDGVGPSVPKLPRVNAKKSTKFDVRHVTCVGCNSDTRVDAEEIGEYVRRNMHSCGEEELWRRAANEWKRIREERRVTNSRILPTWSWKEIRSHFKKCCYDEQIDTLDDIRGVNQLINVTKGTMLRKHPETGVITVHAATFKQYTDLMTLKMKLTATNKRKASTR